MAIGMAKHSKSSFDEEDAVNKLSIFLESTHKIKTFFKVNDRTPNYDGSFELVSQNGEPQKQFIVQIKKTKGLEKCKEGKNKGKYLYLLETSFLYYVKAKVTESPAIYFVVDIENSRIFYLYLSDEALMNLDFEGKEHVSYSFSENQIIRDIDAFYNELSIIASNRNKKYLYKTPEQIAELQEAADYINDLLNGDLKTIKEVCFPNLWRFGIGMSQTSDLKINVVKPDRKEVPIPNTEKVNMFGLYPQFKGSVNPGIGDYDYGSFGTIIDCKGEGKPIEYAKRNLHDIIQQFCLNPPVKLIPTVALEEKIYKKAAFVSNLFGKKDPLLIEELYDEMNTIFAYLEQLFFYNHSDSDGEQQFRTMVNNLLRSVSNPIDISNFLMMGCIKKELMEFANKIEKNDFNAEKMFGLISFDTIELYFDLIELKNRGANEIHSQWRELSTALYQDDIGVVNRIFDELTLQMPKVYSDFYKNVFSKNNEYKYECKADYCIKKDINANAKAVKYFMVINHYKVEDDNIYILQKNIDDFQVSEQERMAGVISKEIRANLVSLVSNQRLLYDGIRCWLYKGICNKLGYKKDVFNAVTFF